MTSLPDVPVIPDQNRDRVIALDVGGTSIKSAVVAQGGILMSEFALNPVDSGAEAESILATFSAVIKKHVPAGSHGQLLGIAIGFPGPFDYESGICLIEGVEKYASINGINVGESLKRALRVENVSILFRNDAEAAVVGEACYGAGSPYARVIGITLGTGCGSAFTVNGLIVRTGLGVPPNGWLYPVPFRGARADDCFSRRGLEKQLASSGIFPTDVKQAAQLARAGDQRARQVFESFGTDLGEFLDPFAKAFQADALLVLGQISGAFDLFGPFISQIVSVPVLPGRLGPEAALLGAADLFFKQCQEAS